jgi:LPS sulfotransferase NodH
MLTRRASPPETIWSLCTVARSGSSWLCELVQSTGCLGYPAEYLLDWSRQSVKAGLSANGTWDDYLEFLFRRYTTANGVFAVKGSIAELQPFLDRFPHTPCVWLRREDRCAQAISWYRADAGGLWTRTSDMAPRGIDELAWCETRARWFFEEILRREQRWYDYFQSRRNLPLILTYESVCAEPLAAVRAIGDHVGISTKHVVSVESRLRVVRDEQSRIWSERLAASLAANPTPFTSAIDAGHSMP